MTNARPQPDIEHFVAALDFDFLSAKEISRRLREAGTPTTLATIRSMMRQFVHVGGVEANGDAWRIEPTPANDNTPPEPPTSDPVLRLSNLHHGCGLTAMRAMNDESVDLVLCDLPYGVSGLAIDPTIDVDAWMTEMRRIVTPTGAIVAFAQQPFTTDLIIAGRDIFKQALVWEKVKPTGFQQSATRHLKTHEDILVFSKGTIIRRSDRRMTYNPQGVEFVARKMRPPRRFKYLDKKVGGNTRTGEIYQAMTNCPRSVLRYAKDSATHPFAKPIALLEYLIRTFSNDGEVVLDPTIGSGSTGIAANIVGREWIGFEADSKFYNIAVARLVAESPARVTPMTVPAQPAAPCDVPANDNTAIAPTIVGDATLYNADCLDALRALPDASVDLVVTSPPYNLRARMSRQTGKWKNSKLFREGYEAHDDAMDDADYVEWQKEVLRECWRVLTPTGAIYYNHKARILDGVMLEPSRLNPGLPLRQIITWDRGRGMNFSDSYYLPVAEQILIFAKPGFRLRDKGASGAKDVWRFPPESSTNRHAAPFPIDLPRTAIETTSAKVILDPFMGSGTTGVAALQLGRRFIGIENGPNTFEGAAHRIRCAA